ncbi:MAG TPA: hypothetical protein PLQ67_07270, partial [Burkholderiaceae bacterium]|nr:hypothetical protein [Burkholderiaceae bacterium]
MKSIYVAAFASVLLAACGKPAPEAQAPEAPEVVAPAPAPAEPAPAPAPEAMSQGGDAAANNAMSG